MNVKRFIENIVEQIKEAQLKLGYVKEVIRLYYQAESLCDLLELPYQDGKELLLVLEKETDFLDTELGKIGFSLCHDQNRIEVRISPDGTEYVHKYVQAPPFLAGLIQLFQEHHKLSIEEICAYFERFSEHYICEKMQPGTDFDYVMYFEDQKPDSWYYCIRTEMDHTIYHRFTKSDYSKIVDK